MKKQMKMSGIGFYVLVLAVIFVAVYFSGNIERNSGDSYSISSLKMMLVKTILQVFQLIRTRRYRQVKLP